jgi:thiol-disulfide isomerase/thioredoxin
MMEAMFRSCARPLLVAGLFVFTLALTAAPLADGPPPSFEGNAGWINSPALTPDDLRGKIVLVDFWEYTCVNCLRTLPYLRAWYDRYGKDGFVIVGVHTPEFGFSGDKANVAAATERLGISWPVVLDDRRAIWARYNNDAWPHEYLFDQSGHLVESLAGEGAYPATESRIQALLRAQNPQLSLPPVMALLPQDSYDKPGAMCYPRTPELLIGHVGIADAAAYNDASAADAKYNDPGAHKDGAIYLQGTWHLTRQAAVSVSALGYVAVRYHAIQVVGVMAPENGRSVRVDVTQDGSPVAKPDAGSDIKYDGSKSYVTVDSSREYDLLMNAKFGQHELELTPEEAGVGVYSFAFESCEAGTDK